MPSTLKCTASLSSISRTNQVCRAASTTRSFSTSPRNEQRVTRARRGLFRWLATQGANFANPLEGSTNYLGAYTAQGQLRRVVDAERFKGTEKKEEGKAAAHNTRSLEGFLEGKESEGSKDPDGNKIPEETPKDWIPFPGNRNFISQPVLGGMVKEEVWFRIMIEGKSVRQVSAELGIEMSRVGAVVRLKEIEKEWERIGKPLANAYQRAIMKMVPKTTLALPDKPINRHESINDLPVHRATGQQIFHPTAESRHFTRVDAAKVFDDKLLPADYRVPHPELVVLHKEVLDDLPPVERQKRAGAREASAEKKRLASVARLARKEAAIKKVDTGRWEFHFTEVNVDDAGKTGRGHKGTGWRYGVPHMDRSRGQIKIPTSVE